QELGDPAAVVHCHGLGRKNDPVLGPVAGETWLPSDRRACQDHGNELLADRHFLAAEVVDIDLRGIFSRQDRATFASTFRLLAAYKLRRVDDLQRARRHGYADRLLRDYLLIRHDIDSACDDLGLWLAWNPMVLDAKQERVDLFAGEVARPVCRVDRGDKRRDRRRSDQFHVPVPSTLGNSDCDRLVQRIRRTERQVVGAWVHADSVWHGVCPCMLRGRLLAQSTCWKRGRAVGHVSTRTTGKQFRLNYSRVCRSVWHLTEILQMNPKLASMFAFSRPSCKTDARCRPLLAPRVTRTLGRGSDLAIFSWYLDALLLSVALERMTSNISH